MLRFECDYTEGCIPEILEAIQRENHTQLPGYSEDPISVRAKEKVRALCGDRNVDVHFLVGGTQANTTIIAAALRPHQGVLAAQQGHIACHETGAIEAAGHKVLSLPSETGRLTAGQIRAFCAAHWADATHEHQVQPAMVYLSHPAENGTLYTLEELDAMEQVIAGLDSVGMLATASELSVKNLDNLYYTTSAGVKVELGNLSSLHTKLLIAREVLALREADEGVTGAKIDVSNGKNAHYIPAILPTVTPTPTTTPTPSPTAAP